MNLRLLPLLAITASALLALKVLGFVMGAPHGVTGPIGGAVAQETQPAAGSDKPDKTVSTETDGDMPPSEAESDVGGEEEATGNEPPPLPNSLEMGGSEAERAVLESLGKRRENLNSQQQQLDLREKLLKATEERVQKRVDELKQLEQQIEGAVAEKKKKEEEELNSLVSMYENMKPKDAARIFDRLNLPVLLKVVRRMKPRKMADILGKMSSEAAERLTVAIATEAGGGHAEKMQSGETRQLPKIGSN